MSDDIDKIIDAPSGGDQKTQPDNAQAEDWKTITGGKYKTEAELAKAYKEMETKLGQTSDEIRQTREFAQIVNPILEEIRNDPEIFQKLEKKLADKGKPASETKTESKVESRQSDETRTATSDMIIEKFEDKYGIRSLSESDRRNMRASIGDTIQTMTGLKLEQIDLRRLNGVLENAYVLANKDKLIDQAKAEALVARKNNDGAAFSSMPASQGKGEDTLTSEESSVATKLGLSREDYLKGKRK